MNISYLLLQIPPLMLLLIMVVLFTGIGMSGTYLFRRYSNIHPRRSHNELIGYVFATLGGFYGLLLGFVVFLVWDSVNGAQSDNSREGSIARALYRDIKYYPNPAKVATLKSSYLAYVHDVVEREFPALESMKTLDSSNRVTFNNVFKTIGQLPSQDPYTQEMFKQLNELATYRSLRQLDASSSIPMEIWIPLLLGAAIILAFAMMLDVESRRLHIAVNGLLGAFIGMVIYIIVILDHPFTGHMKIEPDEYNTILAMEQQDV